ncbi:hypothetical protein [Cellvibrio mixtus]|uniref:hypothetical protein n=1 Tax=Cellvibrio mixtus TaxID=39650 RepID=UPI00058658AB|nr:hypothetical protein [Cellvibrio mixtus]
MGRYTASLASAVLCVVGCVLMVAFAVVPSPVLAADVAASVPVVASAPAVAADAVAEVSFITWLLANVPDVLQLLSLVVALASSFAALTPTPKDDGVLLWLRKAIDFLALNFLGAKNAKSNKDFSSYR